MKGVIGARNDTVTKNVVVRCSNGTVPFPSVCPRAEDDMGVLGLRRELDFRELIASEFATVEFAATTVRKLP